MRRDKSVENQEVKILCLVRLTKRRDPESWALHRKELIRTPIVKFLHFWVGVLLIS